MKSSCVSITVFLFSSGSYLVAAINCLHQYPEYAYLKVESYWMTCPHWPINCLLHYEVQMYVVLSNISFSATLLQEVRIPDFSFGAAAIKRTRGEGKLLVCLCSFDEPLDLLNLFNWNIYFIEKFIFVIRFKTLQFIIRCKFKHKNEKKLIFFLKFLKTLRFQKLVLIFILTIGNSWNKWSDCSSVKQKCVWPVLDQWPTTCFHFPIVYIDDFMETLVIGLCFIVDT